MRTVALGLFDEERRQCKRVPLATNAYLLSPGSRRALSATVENISVGGIGLRAPYSVPIGKAIHVLIELGDQPVDTTAIVIRGRANTGYGLKFIHVDRQGMESICRYIVARADQIKAPVRREKQTVSLRGVIDPLSGRR